MRVLDLFSGIGGFSLGLERAGMETIAFCEIDPYCRRVLKKHWPDVPIYEDVRELRGDEFGDVDLICGGYPCQPFSEAGKRRGTEDDRHLWPAMFNIIKRCHPTWILCENVIGHISMGLDEVLSDMVSLHYTTATLSIPACAVNSPQYRNRIWLLAYAKSDAKRRPQPDNSDSEFGKAWEIEAPQTGGRFSDCRTHDWCAVPRFCRVADGISANVDRISALGNAVVPQLVEVIGRAIMKANAA